MGHATTAPVRRTGRALTGAAGALLTPRLGATAGDLNGLRVGDLAANREMYEQIPRLSIGGTAGPFRVAEGLQRRADEALQEAVAARRAALGELNEARHTARADAAAAAAACRT